MANKSFIELLQASSTNMLDTIAMVNSGTTDTFQINKQFFLSNQVPFKYVNGNGNIATMFCSDNSITTDQMYSSILGGLQHRIINGSGDGNIGIGNVISGGWQNGIGAPGYGNFIAGGRQNYIEGNRGIPDYNFIGGGFRNTINTSSRSAGALVGSQNSNVSGDAGFCLGVGDSNTIGSRFTLVVGTSNNTGSHTWSYMLGQSNTHSTNNSFLGFSFGLSNQIRGNSNYCDYHFGSKGSISKTTYIYNENSSNGTLGTEVGRYAGVNDFSDDYYGRNNSIIASYYCNLFNPTTNTTRGNHNGFLFESNSSISGSTFTGFMFGTGNTANDKTNAIGIGLKNKTLIANDTTHLEALILMTPLTEYSNNAAAKAGGLIDGQLYRDSSGGIHIVFT